MRKVNSAIQQNVKRSFVEILLSDDAKKQKLQRVGIKRRFIDARDIKTRSNIELIAYENDKNKFITSRKEAM